MFAVVEEEQTASTSLAVEGSIDPLSVSLLDEPAQSSSATMTDQLCVTHTHRAHAELSKSSLRVVADDSTDVI